MEITANHNKRATKIILSDIKDLIKNKGFIYVLCIIILDDLTFIPEEIHKIDHYSNLSKKEVSFLIGILIQDEIDYSIPDSPKDLMILKQKTYVLMNELHYSFMKTFSEKLKEIINSKHKIENSRKEEKELYTKSDLIVESIFYSGDGVYDFQYLDFLEKKYKYDKVWLLENKRFDLLKSKNIVIQIKNILQEKLNTEYYFNLKKNLVDDLENDSETIISIAEFWRYVELFFFNQTDEKKLNIDKIGEEEWKLFYRELLDLFIIKKTDFAIDSDFDSFLRNFSLIPQKRFNLQCQNIGNFNWFNAKPIIQIENDKYFVPIIFSVFEAIYESPFYWMKDGNKLIPEAAEHRGKVGEEITYEFLSQLFGKNRAYRSVKIKSPKTKKSTQQTKIDTDIDILCILGSKALCVQVKSKKLTELSRTGDDKQLQKDFKKAAQDAYQQGLISRSKILKRDAKFFDINGNEIVLSEKIDEVYILGITTENYPSLVLQAHVLLEKKDNDPFPLFITIFDLELLVHYLNDPYNFLYYIKQRTSLMDNIWADEEAAFLGFHLIKKLNKIPNVTHYIIDTDFAKLIDRNYYPLKAGIKVSNKGDAVSSMWKNENFEILCKQLMSFNEANITDIIFHLLDLSFESREQLIDMIIQTKLRVLRDNKIHDFSLLPHDRDSIRLGISYIVLNSNKLEDLKISLLTLCQVRKYKDKGNIWIGFGSMKESNNIIDIAVFNNQPWKYNKELEDLQKELLGHGRKIILGKKVGRNEMCQCGSGVKYKKCCGKIQKFLK